MLETRYVKHVLETTSDADADRCKEAFAKGRRVTVTRLDVSTRQTREYVGHVLSVQYSSGRPWLIAIDAD